MKVRFGKTLDARGQAVMFDVQTFVETRLLAQANSGGGKSNLLRRLLEVSHGKIQQVVLDMEGEFASLREKFDYVLVAKGGDIPADVRTADVLARKLLELEASAIIDLYELRHHDRIRYVRLFLEAMMNSPKELWHPVMVVIDEAHVFAPEKGQSEAMNAVVDLATRGRKRGFACVLATQRLSKLHKDVAAECLNKLVGRTGLDIDMKRAGDELGLTSKLDTAKLRTMAPGTFWAYGPALTEPPALVQVEKAETAFDRTRAKTWRAPAPSGKVKGVLAKLADLPKEAQAEADERVRLRSEVQDLRRQLAAKPVPPAPPPPVVAKEVPKAKLEAMAKRALEDARRAAAGVVKAAVRDVEESVGLALRNARDGVLRDLGELAPPAIEAEKHGNSALNALRPQAQPRPATLTHSPGNSPAVRAALHSIARAPRPAPARDGDPPAVSPTERAVLQFLAAREGKAFTRAQIGAWTGYSVKSSSFDGALARLVRLGLIGRAAGKYIIEDAEGVRAEVGGDFEEPPRSILEWIPKLKPTPGRILQLLIDNSDRAFTRDTIAEETGYSPTSSSFDGAISELRSLQLVHREHDGSLRLNPEIAGGAL